MKQLTPWILTAALAVALPATDTKAAQGNGSGTPSGAPTTAADRGGQRRGGTPPVDGITVTGCVTRNDAATAADGRAGGQAPGSRKSGPEFLLIDATASSANATSTGIGPGGASTYALEGPRLADHVGQQVQVTGTLVPPAGSSRGTGGSAVSAPASGAAAEGRLRVRSVRMVSRTCANQSH